MGTVSRCSTAEQAAREPSFCAHPRPMSHTTPARRSGRMSRDRSTRMFTGHADLSASRLRARCLSKLCPTSSTGQSGSTRSPKNLAAGRAGVQSAEIEHVG